MRNDILNQFTAFVSRNELFGKSEPVLLAVSGGIDSVVMCRLFSLAGFRFGIAHCNFGLRGRDSDDDEQFVATLAEQLQVPFFSKHFDTQSYAASNKISVEMAARDLRYQWLEETRIANGYHKIATAHHRDDSIETVLLNLVKGTGISGLHGILPKRDQLVRPLLCFGKEEIIDFAGIEKLDFRQDHTNLESVYQRNILRNKVIPHLREINPDFSTTFTRNIGKFRDAEMIYKKGLQALRKKVMEKRGGEWYIPIRKLFLFPGHKTILFEILRDFGFGEKQVEQICEGLHGQPGRQYFSEQFRVIKDRSFLIVTAKKEEDSGLVLIEDIKKTVKLSDGELSFHWMQGSELNMDAGNDVAFADYSQLRFPLILRRWRSGDYFYPLGLNKKKKLSDFLTDLKLSMLEKEKTWVLLSEEKVVWVVGYRIDERFKVTPQTKETLKMKWR